VTPAPALWGPARSLETPHFVFHFRQYDAAAVIAIASQSEALYTTLQRNVGLPVTHGVEKLVIEISVTQPTAQAAPWSSAPERVVVPSPAVYLAPVELTDEELLVQAIALPLLAAVLAQANEQYEIDSAWQPLFNGLRLWHIWDLNLPLAAWRRNVVQWTYTNAPSASAEQLVSLPEHYEALCTAHRLWMVSPIELGIPLFCTELDRQPWYFTSWCSQNPPRHLDQLTRLRLPEGHLGQSAASYVPHLGQTVALATLIGLWWLPMGVNACRHWWPVWGNTKAGRPCSRRSLASRLLNSRPAGKRIYRRTTAFLIARSVVHGNTWAGFFNAACPCRLTEIESPCSLSVCTRVKWWCIPKVETQFRIRQNLARSPSPPTNVHV
jgi:hypothetical protein